MALGSTWEFKHGYDDEGNRLPRVRISGAAADDKTLEYTWDHRNRLEKVTFKRNDGTVTKTVDLRYDMFNQLTQKVVDPDGALGSASLQTDDYLWDGDELVGITGYNSLVFASGPAPDMVLFEDGSALHALLGDHQNTVRDVINTSGTVENHLVYNSYGELKSQTGGGAYSPFHRFTGKPFDVAVGLQYNINRWYDPATGRWTSEDPIGFGGGHANLNVYAGNSPVVGTDSAGLFPVNPEPGIQVPTYQSRKGYVPGYEGDLEGIFLPPLDITDPRPIFDYGPQIPQDVVDNTRREAGGFGPPPIPSDPTQPPGPGWKWTGKDPPGGRGGGWVGPGGQSLHPDLTHPAGKDPHWTWNDPYGNKWDYFPDTNAWVPNPSNNPNKPQPVFPPGTLKIVAVEIGAGVIIYIVIRTGGRILFPPSNAIPAFP